MALLEVKDVSVHYGRIQAISDVSISVEEGEVVSLIGANGAGKTTSMKAIAGLLNLSHGSITFAGNDIGQLKGHQRVARGISLVPEGRGIFPAMTVMSMIETSTFLIVTGSRLIPTTQAVSQGAGHSRPVNSGKLFV